VLFPLINCAFKRFFLNIIDDALSVKIFIMPSKPKAIQRFPYAFLLCIFLLAGTAPVMAQSRFTLIAYPPELNDFPKISVYIDAYDAQGKFIESLDLDDFIIQEDGFERMVNETQLIEPGLHTIIVYNLGATMDNRADSIAPNRFEESVFAIASWLNELESQAQNQYTLSSNEGLLAENLQEKDAFTYLLQNYKPNLYNFQPDFSSLATALNAASKPNLVARSKQAVLFITPLPLDQSLDQLPSLQARALEIGVPVHVWLMAPETASNAPAAEQLRQFSASTGGNFLFYAEGSQMPDPEDYVGRLRRIYQVRYTSKITQSGSHNILVKANYGNQTVQSNEISFNIDLNLPTIYIQDLPAEINRDYENTPTGRQLMPSVITVSADVVFPDGYDRQLKATRLYVDGDIVAENTEAPFDFFGWPLEDYQLSGEHLVSVEAEDILGFRSITPPASVMISVESNYPEWVTSALVFLSRGGWIALAVVFVGGTIYAGLRIRNRMLATANGEIDEEYASIDPLDQPIPGVGSLDESFATTSSVKNRQSVQEEIFPVLELTGATQPANIEKNLQIIDKLIIIGCDPQQSDFTFPDESISVQHACLVRQDSGAVRISDLGSETGTWVNYAPVSGAGTILNDGDLVQIGKFSFRYKIGM